MKITKEQILHVAKLSHLAPDQEELDALRGDLEEILSAMSMLSEPDEGLDRIHIYSEYPQVGRDDTAIASSDRAKLLANAPVQNGESIVVPRTLE